MVGKNERNGKRRWVVSLLKHHVLTIFLTNLQIRQFSGAVVSTKGLFMSESDKGKAGYVK